jgi:hypothetical protein
MFINKFPGKSSLPCIRQNADCVFKSRALVPSNNKMCNLMDYACFLRVLLANLHKPLTLMTNVLYKKKLHGLSPQANYTDRETAVCRQNDCQLSRIEGATWSAWRIPTAVFLVSRQEQLLFYQVATQLYSRGWVDPVPDPLLFFSGSAGNRNRASGSVAKNSDH